MTKQKTLALTAIIMATAFFVSLLWGYSQYQQSRQALQLLENEYQRAYYNYLADIDQLGTALSRAQGSSAHQRSLALGQISAIAASAADNMALLPLAQYSYQRSTAYLNQISDYSLSLAAQLNKGGELSADAQPQLAKISEDLKALSGQMSEMALAVAGGDIKFSAGLVEQNPWQTLRESLGGAKQAQGAKAAIDEISADGYFSRADTLLGESELLAYAGKYSSHMDDLPIKGLADYRNISADEALGIAEEFLANLAYQNPQLVEEYIIDEQGAMPLYSYIFESANPGGGHIYLSISKAGGKIISYFGEPIMAEQEQQEQQEQVDMEQAIKEAESILDDLGYGDIKLSSQQKIGNKWHLSYHHYEDEILYYPDQVDINIDAYSGQIIALNSSLYWTNHNQRILPEQIPEFSETSALLGTDAAISASGLVYIDNGAGGETLCHEYHHNRGEQSFISHIGLDSMAEEQVLNFYNGENGEFYFN